jgi:folylpolyglutamate synthase/dihydropteroate synthase
MIILNGFLKDKDFSACAKILAPHAALAVVTHPRSDRFVGGGEVVKAWEKAGIRAFWVGDWRQALEFSRSLVQGSKSPLLVMGSLYLVGACRKEMVGNRGLAKI